MQSPWLLKFYVYQLNLTNQLAELLLNGARVVFMKMLRILQK